jgi:hypothetical protein
MSAFLKSSPWDVLQRQFLAGCCNALAPMQLKLHSRYGPKIPIILRNLTLMYESAVLDGGPWDAL